jgi:7-alpha-hydroxysteroid dehydrogenase
MTMLLDRFNVTDRVAIVTGSGRGIGAAIALALAENGADIVLTSRTREQLEVVAKQVEAYGRRALILPGDVEDETHLASLATEAVKEFGRLDIVVNNAGGTPPRPFLETSSRMFERALHFNVTTAFNMTRLATPHLLAGGGGAVVNISSAIGRLTDRGFVAYGTAKGALAHMTRMTACELAPRIRVNGIAVGSVQTEALDTVLTDELRQEMIDRTPLHRLGHPDDIALCALYLASDAGSYVTGKLFEIDGGIEAPNLGLNLPDL